MSTQIPWSLHIHSDEYYSEKSIQAGDFEARMDDIISKAKELGFSMIRSDLCDNKFFELEKGKKNADVLDKSLKFIRKVIDAKLGFVCILKHDPPWLQPGELEQEYVKYLDFVLPGLAGRDLLDKVSYFQLWNEPGWEYPNLQTGEWANILLAADRKLCEVARAKGIPVEKLRMMINILCDPNADGFDALHFPFGGRSYPQWIWLPQPKYYSRYWYEWEKFLKGLFMALNLHDHHIKIIGMDTYPGTWLVTEYYDYSCLDYLVERFLENPASPWYGCRCAIAETGYSTYNSPSPLFNDQGHGPVAQARFVDSAVEAVNDKVRRINFRRPGLVEFCQWYELTDAKTSPVYPLPPFDLPWVESNFGLYTRSEWTWKPDSAKPATVYLRDTIRSTYAPVEKIQSEVYGNYNVVTPTFDDKKFAENASLHLSKISLDYDHYCIHGLQCEWKNRVGETFRGEYHGKKRDTDKHYDFPLADDEHVTRIDTRSTVWVWRSTGLILQIQFTTNKGRSSISVGGPAHDEFRRDIFDGIWLTGFYGSNSHPDKVIDRLGFYSFHDDYETTKLLAHSPKKGYFAGRKEAVGEFDDMGGLVGAWHLRRVDVQSHFPHADWAITGLRCHWDRNVDDDRKVEAHKGAWHPSEEVRTCYSFFLASDEYINTIEIRTDKPNTKVYGIRFSTNRGRESDFIGRIADGVSVLCGGEILAGFYGNGTTGPTAEVRGLGIISGHRLVSSELSETTFSETPEDVDKLVEVGTSD